MRTSGIKEGDIVKCDVRGWRFMALVVSNGLEFNPIARRKAVEIKPVVPQQTAPPTRFVTARQIVGHWKKQRTS